MDREISMHMFKFEREFESKHVPLQNYKNLSASLQIDLEIARTELKVMTDKFNSVQKRLSHVTEE